MAREIHRRIEAAIKFRSQVLDAFAGRQNVIGQMIDELTARIQTLPAQRAAWHNDAAATPRFIHERP